MEVDFCKAKNNIMCSIKETNLKNNLQKFLDNQLLEKEPLVWLKSSGTQSTNTRFLGFSKDGLLASAQSVNNHLNIDSNDIFIQSLPIYHIGGLSLAIRAQLAKAKIYNMRLKKWNAKKFSQELLEKKITIVSLVPTQLYDLVVNQIKPSQFLRLVLIGGGALSKELYLKAVQMGWPLILTYGMTEAGSQIATSSLKFLYSENKPPMELLPHIECTLEKKQLFIRGQSVFLYECFMSKNNDFKLKKRSIDEWYKTNDKVNIKGKQLTFISRIGSEYKISGFLVDLNKLRNTWSEIHPHSLIQLCINSRRGYDVIVVAENSNFPLEAQLLKQFDDKVMPYEKIKKIYYLPNLEKTSIGKVKMNQDIFESSPYC
jgi:O-succinylbenzoic acid--CoA ligase